MQAEQQRARVLRAIAVRATYTTVGPGLTGVALLRFDESRAVEQTDHGAYPTRTMAWQAAELMTSWLQRIIDAQGFFTDDDVDRVFRMADSMVRRSASGVRPKVG
jgi:hypothetical protein